MCMMCIMWVIVHYSCSRIVLTGTIYHVLQNVIDLSNCIICDYFIRLSQVPSGIILPVIKRLITVQVCAITRLSALTVLCRHILYYTICVKISRFISTLVVFQE